MAIPCGVRVSGASTHSLLLIHGVLLDVQWYHRNQPAGVVHGAIQLRYEGWEGRCTCVVAPIEVMPMHAVVSANEHANIVVFACEHVFLATH